LIRKSYFEAALSTPEAREAFIQGLTVLIRTGNFDAGWKAMIEAGRRNGALAIVEVGAVADLLKWFWDKLQGK
jgi:hypothetical protein